MCQTASQSVQLDVLICISYYGLPHHCRGKCGVHTFQALVIMLAIMPLSCIHTLRPGSLGSLGVVTEHVIKA